MIFDTDDPVVRDRIYRAVSTPAIALDQARSSALTQQIIDSINTAPPIAAHGDSGAEARAEPSEASLRGVGRDNPLADLWERVEELERWRSTFKSEMVERPSPPPPSPPVTCATCRGFGTYGTGVCPACKGAGVHRV